MFQCNPSSGISYVPLPSYLIKLLIFGIRSAEEHPYALFKNMFCLFHLIGASVQIYMNNPPTIKQGIESYENVTPLFNGIVNSTGNLTSNLSYSFFQYVENWYHFFSLTNNSGANAALTIQITYYYEIGNYTYVSYYTNIITINPAYYMNMFNLPSLGSPNGLQMNVITNNMPISIISNPSGGYVTGQFNIPVCIN